jgi:CheY-like chemotaxis protein/tRNA A-37 threonylcarbamoyl transferase component Bud32
MNPSEYNLLVVDDNPENRDVLSRRLMRKGFEVRTAEGGEEALRIIGEGAIDLVLLDIMMPGVSGIDVLREVRRTHDEAALPIIMATAKTESEDIVECLELGANDYVTKPIDFPVVLARIQMQLRTRQSRQARETAAVAAALETIGPSVSELGPGMLLAERYRLDSQVGSGAFGAVYRATHLELDTAVAVKILRTSVETGAEAVARFRREGISTCRVKHPNAVTVVDFGVTNSGVAYLVMELLEGLSLQDDLELRSSFSPERCAQILLPVCDVLAVAHEAGIIHRDIKPSNIFIQETIRGAVIKVLDFGIAKIVGADALSRSLTLDGTILGTPAYMAPERFKSGAYDGRSDVYSLGITLYQMLESRLPFVNPTDAMAVAMMHLHDPPPPLRSVHADVRETMQGVLDVALEKNPDDRPDALEFRKVLASAVESLGEAADYVRLDIVSPDEDRDAASLNLDFTALDETGPINEE